MKLFSKGAELSLYLDKIAEKPVGFVPTMGALHIGHIALVHRCREECGTVVASIFVNPTQFNDPEDLRKYPRTRERDIRQLQSAGADVVYLPDEKDIYPEPDTRVFDFGDLDKVMEGAFRPGHFNGVAQVVSRLFDIVKPDKAYFGEKDFQQLALIREMVRMMGFPVEIVGCPTVRESDGLAFSSRNVLLSAPQREASPVIYQALERGIEAARKSAMSVSEVKDMVIEHIDREAELQTEYFSIVDARTLAEVKDWNDARCLRGCVAVRAGGIRLIDNIDYTK